MNQKKAKELRSQYYGDYSPKAKKLFRDTRNGQIVADEKRRGYQELKRSYNLAKSQG